MESFDCAEIFLKERITQHAEMLPTRDRFPFSESSVSVSLIEAASSLFTEFYFKMLLHFSL